MKPIRPVEIAVGCVTMVVACIAWAWLTLEMVAERWWER